MTEKNLTSHISHLTSYYVIIVAGGSGTRMQAAVPKQFLLLNGKPVLMHTIEAFFNSDAKPSIIIVLPADYHEYWQQLCTEHAFAISHQLVSGGETRFHSVKNGLNLINGDAVIAVHDAVRPLTGKAVIDEAFRYTAEHGNGVVAVQSRDSIRQVKSEMSMALVRDEIYLVQTPQVFKSDILRQAYQQEYKHTFTDDASVVEQLGININIVAGSYTNLKITFPEDIAIAELLLREI